MKTINASYNIRKEGGKNIRAFVKKELSSSGWQVNKFKNSCDAILALYLEVGKSINELREKIREEGENEETTNLREKLRKILKEMDQSPDTVLWFRRTIKTKEKELREEGEKLSIASKPIVLNSFFKIWNSQKVAKEEILYTAEAGLEKELEQALALTLVAAELNYRNSKG